MSTAQTHMPVKLVIYDAAGQPCAERKLGNLKRKDSIAIVADELLPSGYGHMELVYDFDAGQEADGWLHALFRYEDRETGHAAEVKLKETGKLHIKGKEYIVEDGDIINIRHSS